MTDFESPADSDSIDVNVVGRGQRPWSYVVERRFWIAFGVMVFFCVVMLFNGGWQQKVVLSGVKVLPFFPLILFTTIARQRAGMRAVAVAYWLLLGLALSAISGGVALAAVVDLQAVRNDDGSILNHVRPGGFRAIIQVVLWSLASVAVGALAFAPGVRRFAAKFSPIDPDSFPDAIGLASAVALILGCFVPLAVLHDPPMLRLADIDQEITFFDLYGDLSWLVPCCIFAAGFPLIRGLPAALARLGLVRPTIRQLLFAPVAALALVGFMLAFEHYESQLWHRFGLPTTDEKKFEHLMKFALSVSGAIAVGVTAGLGEELTYRGLLQPRLGLWMSNLLFMSGHAIQYHADGLVSVFVVGLVLGEIRRRTNTTTSALVHGIYDFILVLAMAGKIPGFTPGG